MNNRKGAAAPFLFGRVLLFGVCGHIFVYCFLFGFSYSLFGV
ncbi:hypothetical protein X559_1262 [Paenilisteria newyorkensis]|nr:hypothetical protein X559_1262 [Listeria newyorkensis]